MASTPNVGLVTGGSRGLGLALATALVHRGWHVVIDARDATRLHEAAANLRRSAPDGAVTAIAGNVTDPHHRDDLVRAVDDLGRLDLLVNNASILGPSPLPPLAGHPLDVLVDVLAVNTIAPLALVQRLLPQLRRSRGRILDISSDAAVEAYEGWGGYGAAKAALDHLTAVLAAENPDLRIYAVDPGDMATDLHQQAFPGEDVSDLPEPETVVPALLRLIAGDLPSGRYRAADLQPHHSPDSGRASVHA